MPGLGCTLLLLTALVVIAGCWTRLGPARALGLGVAAPLVSASALGVLLLDLGALRRGPLLFGLALLAGAAALGVGWLRRRVAPRPTSAPASGTRACWLAAAVIVAFGTWLRAAPSPYLHGGQDQGIYVNVGHHVARTGRLRPIDPLMAGRVRGVRGADIRAAHHVRRLADDSPLRGRSEGRWLAGLHIEDARAGRLVPAFFHLLPTWFAMAELDLGFARSTWPLTLFAFASLLAALGLGLRIAAGCAADRAPRPTAWIWPSGLVAALALALHPLDLWFSSFPVTENLARASLLGACWLALEAELSKDQDTVAPLLGGLAGATFGLGVFARGSALALALVLIAALLLTPRTRARGALLSGLTIAAALGAVQGSSARGRTSSTRRRGTSPSPAHARSAPRVGVRAAGRRAHHRRRPRGRALRVTGARDRERAAATRRRRAHARGAGLRGRPRAGARGRVRLARPRSTCSRRSRATAASRRCSAGSPASRWRSRAPIAARCRGSRSPPPRCCSACARRACATSSTTRATTWPRSSRRW
ncbi:MAG: hypothetical protein H6713_39420 [Myxococcales bacterium]|nr:hypothetical protein [Myxococcales bacterium]